MINHSLLHPDLELCALLPSARKTLCPEHPVSAPNGHTREPACDTPCGADRRCFLQTSLVSISSGRARPSVLL